ncbi:MAG: hypothetical protein V4642_06260 [Bacteroidota bacterium]
MKNHLLLLSFFVLFISATAVQAQGDVYVARTGEVSIPSIYAGIAPKPHVYLEIGNQMAFYGGPGMYINQNAWWDVTRGSRVRYIKGGGAILHSFSDFYGTKGDFAIQVFGEGAADSPIPGPNDDPSRVFYINNLGNISIGAGMKKPVPSNAEDKDANPNQKLWIAGNTRVDGILSVGTNGDAPTDLFKAYIVGNMAVKGTINTQEVIVSTEKADWPDYVFKSDYKLAPLSEIEQHIKQTGHLPGIPSEAEVAEKGVNVGELQAKLLQKIEELTLYSIEQQKLIKAMQERLDILESQTNSK